MKTRPATAADMEFLSALFETHRGILYKTTLDLNVSEDLREDVLHETLLRLLKNVEALRAMGERSRASYLASAVRSVVYDQSDRLRAERQSLTRAAVWSAPGGDPEEEYIERETRAARARALREALDALSDADRLLLLGKYMDGKSDAELGAMLGVDANSVRMKLTRARRRARKLLQRREG